jgi:ABC-type glutathione transport system ATPase component
MAALGGFDFEIGRGEKIALLGESGAGKTTLSQVLLGLLPRDAHVDGALHFGIDPVRIAYVPQEHTENLHPMLQVGTILGEVARANGEKEAVGEVLRWVGLDSAVAGAYPHELSGGQRQRVLMAQALLSRPDLLIADEPTSALDTVYQMEVMALLEKVVKERSISLLFITHNPLLCLHMDRVAVLWKGMIVESTDPESLLSQPVHPYTVQLIGALPPRLGESSTAYC